MEEPTSDINGFKQFCTLFYILNIFPRTFPFSKRSLFIVITKAPLDSRIPLNRIGPVKEQWGRFLQNQNRFSCSITQEAFLAPLYFRPKQQGHYFLRVHNSAGVFTPELINSKLGRSGEANSL